MEPQASDPHIRSLVESQVELAGVSDLERARALRAFAHQLVPLPWQGRSLESRHGSSIQYEPLSVLLPLLSEQDRGFECGGTAYVLARLCQLFDLESYVYNAGIPSTQFSHCVTLVRLRHRGGLGLYLQDAHFNAELQSQDSPITIETALDTLATSAEDSLSWREASEVGRFAVVAPEAESEATALWGRHYGAQRLGDKCDSVLYRLQFNLSRYHLKRAFHDELQRAAGSSFFPAFLLLPLGTSGEPPAEAVASKARQAHQAVMAAKARRA